MNDPTRRWRLKALTDLWTGSVVIERKNGLGERIVPNRFVTTGLLGSIRWWFEVLVRGLGGAACDPSEDGKRCPDQQDKRCVVCELFGCTGWGRKFRFEVQDGSGEVMSNQIRKDTSFILGFTPLRPIADEEWTLLDLTIRLIADYGALGGKTVLKPSCQAGRRGLSHHRDYGMVQVEQWPDIRLSLQDELEDYVRNGRWRKAPQQDFAWASLKNFWRLKGRYLARQGNNESTFNRVLGRKEPKPQSQQLVRNDDKASRWLAGRQQESKKVFSFKEPPCTFGFRRPGVVDFEEIKGRLRKAWPDLEDDEFITGDAILARLTTHAGATA